MEGPAECTVSVVSPCHLGEFLLRRDTTALFHSRIARLTAAFTRGFPPAIHHRELFPGQAKLAILRGFGFAYPGPVKNLLRAFDPRSRWECPPVVPHLGLICRALGLPARDPLAEMVRIAKDETVWPELRFRASAELPPYP